MFFSLSKIEKDVRICLDENVNNTTLLASGDLETLTLNEIIKSKVEEAVRRVHLAAPPDMLETGHNLTGDIKWADQGSGYILLPDDFLRLVVFEMSDWERPVFTAISATHPAYKRQRSRFKGIRGNVQRPVVAILNNNVKSSQQSVDAVYLTNDSIGLRLEFYSSKDNKATVKRAVYIPEPKIRTGSGFEGLDISAMCYQAVIYMCAALVCETLGESERTKALSSLANTYLIPQ